MSTIEVGPFRLIAPLGRGGMGVVWRAIHETQRVPVAIKVITSSHALDPVYQEGFKREVQAVAGLHHPGICEVFDYGEISDAAAAASGGELRAGSPWLAMEYAALGSMENMPALRTWWELREFLLVILDALAHAHARGIVHRDLKPGNILIARTKDERSRYVLTDFGLAHAIEATKLESTRSGMGGTAGTPHYMPPEQLQGYWRDFGPWTDLYAIGCVAYELCCGAPPFDADNFIMLASKHLNDPPPALQPRFEVPVDFERWIHTLMAKDFELRFPRAADAAWALRNLSNEMASATRALPPIAHAPSTRESVFFAPTLASVPELEQAMTVVSAQTLVIDEDDMATLRARDRQDAIELLAPGQPPREPGAPGSHPMRLPMAQTWRRAELRDAPSLIGAGLGLFGLRESPFVDREPQRDEFWRMLEDVYQNGSLRVLSVRGKTGAGKSRFVEWMGERACELGLTTLIRASHNEINGREQGVIHALRHYLRCNQLDRERTYRRLIEIMARYSPAQTHRHQRDAAALTELFAPSSRGEDVEGPRVRFSNESERLRALVACVRELCLPRPIILWLDDIQWSSESLAITSALLEHDFPLMIVLTVRTDELTRFPDRDQAITRIEAHEKTSTMGLAPLTHEDHTDFITRLLGLAPELVAEIARLTQGNPLFASQLIGDLVERDALISTASGFALEPGRTIELPSSVQDLWSTRLEELNQGASPSWRETLELAAALGQQFSQRELSSLHRRARLEFDPDVIENLLVRGMLRRSSTQKALLEWEHAMLRESITAHSIASRRWHDLHSLIADSLAGDRSLINLERRGQHLANARRPLEALDVLYEAASANLARSNYAATMSILRNRELLCDELGIDAHDLRRVCTWPIEISVLRFRGKLRESQELIERAILITRPNPEARQTLADVLRAKAATVWLLDDHEGARAAGREALALYQEIGDELGELRILQSYGWVLVLLHDYDAARRLYQRGDELGAKLDDAIDRAWCLHALSDLDIRVGRLDEAQHNGTLARALFERGGARGGLALLEVNFGDLAAARGDFTTARAHYSKSLEEWLALGSGIAAVPYFRQIMLSLRLRDFDAARALFDAGLIGKENYQQNLRACVAELVLCARSRAFDQFDAVLDASNTYCDEARSIYPDILYALQVGAEELERAGEASRLDALHQLIACAFAKSNSPALNPTIRASVVGAHKPVLVK